VIVFWPAWIGAIALTFAVAEGWAIEHNEMTLSAFVWWLSAAFPPIPYIAGFLAGFLTCHFWWGGVVAFGVKN